MAKTIVEMWYEMLEPKKDTTKKAEKGKKVKKAKAKKKVKKAKGKTRAA